MLQKNTAHLYRLFLLWTEEWRGGAVLPHFWMENRPINIRHKSLNKSNKLLLEMPKF